MKRLVPCVLVLSACGGGVGSVNVNIYGEDYIEQEIPAAGGAEAEGLVDGFTVRYDKFLVVLSNLEIGNRHGEVAASSEEAKVWDVKKAGPHTVVRFDELPADRWDRVSIEMKPAAGATAGNADDVDVTLMNDGGYSVVVTGSATNGNGTDTYTFDWRFTTATRFEDCVDADDNPGVNVPTGGRVPMQITIHGDHMFYDDLQSEDPSLRFAPFAAADADADLEVTQAELAAVDLTSLPSDQYGTGGDPSVNDLAAFEAALTRTLVHFQGEGHCHQVKE